MRTLGLARGPRGILLLREGFANVWDQGENIMGGGCFDG